MSLHIRRILLVILLIIIFYMLYWIYRLERSKQRLRQIIKIREIKPQTVDNYDAIDEYYIPNVIWTYWHSDDLPEFVRFNLERWKCTFGNEFEIRLITNSNIFDYIPSCKFPTNLKSYSKPHQADWVRLYLLKHYGGIWADNGILFNDIDALLNMKKNAYKYRAHLVGFFIDGLQTLCDMPVIENWFLMVPHPSSSCSRFIDLWFEEFDKAIEMNFANYRHHAEIKLGVNSQRLFKSNVSAKSFNPNIDVYLTCHLALQTVLQKRFRDARLYLQCAEDTMLRLQYFCDWSNSLISSVVYFNESCCLL